MGAFIFAAGSKDLYFLMLFGATVGVISPSGVRAIVGVVVLVLVPFGPTQGVMLRTPCAPGESRSVCAAVQVSGSTL